MVTFVLVHGAWGGSYGFRHVRRLLHERGHEVHTPSLTGIGERSHLTGPTVNLSLHIRDASNTVLYEDSTDIVLVGFSYGGMVVTGMLDVIGERVASLVYLDALVPADGETAAEVAGMPATGGGLGEAWSVPPLPRELATPEETAWSDARRVNQPLRTLTEPVRLSKPLTEWGFPLTYIKATADPGEADDSAFWRAARHAQASSAWDYHEIDTNHMVPYTRPEQLVGLLDPLG